MAGRPIGRGISTISRPAIFSGSEYYFLRLRYATKEQRTNYEADEYGLHWEDIDEDLSFEGFFDKRETTQLYKLFMAHPELNVSAIARRLGISQSLMAQYISGKKKASDARVALIMNTVREIGQELIAV